jgi:hypothetical protein
MEGSGSGSLQNNYGPGSESWGPKPDHFYKVVVFGKVVYTTLFPVPEFIDPVFAKTSLNRSFSMTKNERFGLVFVKTGSINSGTEESYFVHLKFVI